MSSKGKCRECSFLTCSFHPLFHLTAQYLRDAGREEPDAGRPAAKR